MSPGLILRLVSGLALSLAALSIGYLVKDRFHQKGLADAARACAVAVRSADGDLKPCLPEVRTTAEAARRSAACDAALLPSLRPETRFAMQNSCPSGVKRLAAQADAAEANVADLARQLAEAKAHEAAAVTRAEARAIRSNERTSHAQKAIADAPRDAGGNIACDADCLRQLGI